VTSTALAFGAPSGGVRTGTLKVTVHNGGTGRASLTVSLQLPTFVELVAQTGCTAEAQAYDLYVVCTLGPVEGGATRDIALTFRTMADASTHTVILPRVLVEIPPGLSDPNPENNSADVVLTYA
jgi:hypothetical protein